MSCGASTADIGTAKAASDTLEFNFYEVTYTKKEDDLANVEFGELLKELVGECFSPEHVAVITGGREENRALLEEKFEVWCAILTDLNTFTVAVHIKQLKFLFVFQFS